MGAGAAIGAVVGLTGNENAATTDATGAATKEKPPKKKTTPRNANKSKNAADVELPYLDQQIAKAEKKLNRAERKVRTKQENVLKEQETLANLEAKLTGISPEEMKKDLPALARAEEKLKEEQAALKKAEMERQAAEAAEKKAAEERAAAEKRAAEEKVESDRIEAEKKAAKEKADRLAAEQRAAEERAAKEAAEAAKQKKLAELEKMKKEADAKVPTVSKFISGTKKPSDVKDKGLANLFSIDLNKVVIGGVAGAGLAIAAAVIAASDDSKDVKSTYKVTGKTPDEYLNTGTKKSKTVSISKGPPPDDADASAPTGTVRIPKKTEMPKTQSLPSQLNKDASVTSKPIDNNTTPPATNEPISMAKIMSGDAGAAPPASAAPAKKSYSPFGSKPKAAASSDYLYGAPTSSLPPPVDSTPPQTESPPALANIPGPGSAAPVKKSFSPFGRKPAAAGNDGLYTPSSTAGTVSDNSPVGPIVSEPVPEIPAMDASSINDGGNAASTAASSRKKSYSPFGSKPMAATNDSLYSAPRFAEWDDEPTTAASSDSAELPAMPFAATSLEEVAMTEDTPPSVEAYQEQPMPPPAFNSGAKKSYSPFGSKPQAPGSGTGGGYLDGM